MKNFLVAALTLTGIGCMGASVYYQGPGGGCGAVICWFVALVFNEYLD
jgi:hypothetical protein